MARSAFGSLAPRAAASGLWLKVGALLALIALNVAIFLAPIDYLALGGLAYAGAFAATFIANAAVVIPVPYIPVVAQILRSADNTALVVLLAALGSAMGESVAYFVGRVEKDLFTGHRWYERIHGFFTHEWRAGLFLFFFAIPLNPFFDGGGFGAGALGIRFPVFFVAVFLGRIVRLAILAVIAIGLLGPIGPVPLATR